MEHRGESAGTRVAPRPENFTMWHERLLRKKSWCVAQIRHFAMSPRIAHRKMHGASLYF
jgi:hypothetical protein